MLESPATLFKKETLEQASATLLKKEILAQVFSCEFCEISKNIISYRIPLGDCF